MNQPIMTADAVLAMLQAHTSGLTLRLMRSFKPFKECAGGGYQAIKLADTDWTLDAEAGTATLSPQLFAFKGDAGDVQGWALTKGTTPWVTRERIKGFETEDGAEFEVAYTYMMGPTP